MMWNYRIIMMMMVVCMGSWSATARERQMTEETQKLYGFLQKIQEKGFLFGHQDATLYGVGWKGEKNRSDVKSVCGDYPAVFGWEIGHIELGNAESLDRIDFAEMRKHIQEAYARGGINTISWHLDNPLTGGDAWDVSESGVVKAILPGGEKHELYLQWLQRLARFLASLETPEGIKIPILFRPFHEHTGAWFWWGKGLCTPKEYKRLWKFTVDYLEKSGLNHLLYTYSPANTSDVKAYLECYPGDQYVDILGFDCYQQGGEAGTETFRKALDTELSFLSELAKEKNKPLVVSETGLESLPVADWWTEVLYKTIAPYPVSYVLVWRNAHDLEGHYYAPWPGQVSSADFVKFYRELKTLFLKEIDEHNY